MSELLSNIESVVSPLLIEQGVELVDITYQKQPGGWVLCFYLDKAGGITLDDCEVWSDRLGAVLESSDLFTHSYSLEVSSPGLNRVIKKVQDYSRFAGQRVHVKLFGPIDGQKNFHGTLVGGDEQVIRIKSDDGRELALPRSQVAKSRLDPEISF